MKAHFNLDDKRQTGRKYEASIITSLTGCMFQRLCLMTSTCGKQMYTHQMYYGFPLPAVEEAAPTPDQPVMFEVAAVHIPVVAAVEEFERVYTDRERELQAQIAELQAHVDKLTRKLKTASDMVTQLKAAERAREEHALTGGLHFPTVDLPLVPTGMTPLAYYTERSTPVSLTNDINRFGVDALVQKLAEMEIEHRDRRADA